jgi:hypothetical protein
MASRATPSSSYSPSWLNPLALMLLLLINVWAAYSVYNNNFTEQDPLVAIAAEYPIYDSDFSNQYTLD